jgi:hypothetical protein
MPLAVDCAVIRATEAERWASTRQSTAGASAGHAARARPSPQSTTWGAAANAGSFATLQPALDHEEWRPHDGTHAARDGTSTHPARDVCHALTAVVPQQPLCGRIAAQAGAVHKDLVDHARHLWEILKT